VLLCVCVSLCLISFTCTWASLPDSNKFEFEFEYTIFTGVIHRSATEASPVLGPRHQFPLGSPAFQFFLFNETTTATYTKSLTSLSELSKYDTDEVTMLCLFCALIETSVLRQQL